MTLIHSEPSIGILGGTFNPVHMGHLAIANMACEHFLLPGFLFIPACIQPHKTDIATVSVEHRVAMLEMAIKGNEKFQIWDGEIVRKGLSYTVDTLKVLKKEFEGAKLHFVIGSDNILDLLTWKNYKTIIKMVTLCVVHRAGYSLKIPQELSGADIKIFPSPKWGISSSQIRTDLATGMSGRYILPDSVLKYIKKNKLYV